MRRRRNEAIEVLPTPPSSPPARAVSNGDDECITTETLIQEARVGTTAARKILSTVHDTHVMARDTADSLQRQTAQLEAIAGHVDDTKEILTGAEENIEKLTKPFWRRKGASLQKGKREIRVELWKKRRGKESKEEMVGRVSGGRVEEYEEFDEVVRNELRAQDDILDETGVVVEELRILAVGIGEEVEKEAEIVEGIDVVEVTSRIREGNRKLRHRLKLK